MSDMSAHREHISGLSSSVGVVEMDERPLHPHVEVLQRQIEAVEKFTIPFRLDGVPDLTRSFDPKSGRDIAGMATALRVGDLYHRLKLESVSVMDGDTGGVAVMFPHVNIHHDGTNKIMDVDGVNRAAQTVVDTTKMIIEYETLLGLVQSEALSQDTLRSAYGLTASGLQQKVADLRASLIRDAQTMHNGLSGMQMEVRQERLGSKKAGKVQIRSGAGIMVDDSHVWVAPAGWLAEQGLTPQAQEQGKKADSTKRTKIKVIGIGGMGALILSACLPVSVPATESSPVPIDSIETPQPAETPVSVEPTVAPTEMPGILPTPTAEKSGSGVSVNSRIEVLPGQTVEIEPGSAVVSNTAKSGGGSVETSALSQLNLARVAANNILSNENRSTGMVEVPYLSQPITVEGVEHTFDRVEGDFAYYKSGDNVVKVLIRAPIIDGRVLVSVVNTNEDGNGEVGLASLKPDGSIDQLFLGLVFGENDKVSMAVRDGKYLITVENEQGRFDVRDLGNGKWELVEQVVKSCVSPEAIAAQDAGFEARTGIDLDNLEANEAGRIFAEALEENKFIGFLNNPGGVGFGMIKTGVDLVPINDSTGSGIKDLVCVYGRTGLMPDQTIVVVVGWVDSNGKFQGLGNGDDMVNRKNLPGDDLLNFFKNLPDGAVMSWDVNTFSGLTSADQIQSSNSSSTFPNSERVKKLVGALNNQLIERASGAGNFEDYWALMDPEQGDPGFISAGEFKYFKQIKLK